MADDTYTDDEELEGGENAELLQEARDRFQMARDHWKEWNDEARQCFEFYSGHQWSTDDVEYLQSQLRVPITFNRVQPYIDAVIGHEANNRQEIKYLPRTEGDSAVNQVITEVAHFYLDECDGEYAQSEAFKAMLICGIGWTETRLDDEENPDMDLVVECVNSMHVLPDPTSERPCFSDARYVFKHTQHSKAEVRAMFPEWDGISTGTEWDLYDYDDAGAEDGDLTGRDTYVGDDDADSDTAGRDITVVQYQYKDYEDVYMAKDPETGKEKSISEDVYNNFKKEMKAEGITTRKKSRVVCKVAYIIGSQVVQHSTVCKEHFTLQAITGKRDVSKKTWHGIMRSLLDVQQWSNKFLSQMLHIINSQAKGGLDIEESAVSDMEKFEADYSKPGALLVYRDGALQNNRVRERSSVQFPAQFDRLLQYANDSFGDVAGINAEMMGMADREQPGVLEYQRRQSAVSLLAPLFDSLRLYRKRFGRVWLYFIQKYLADGRIARITVDQEQLQQQQGMQGPPQPPQPGQPGQQPGQPPAMKPPPKTVAVAINTQLLGDPDTAKYDVIVDQSSTSPNQKEATWAVLSQMGPMLKDVMTGPVLMKLLEYSPLPESLMEEIKQITMDAAQQQKPDPEEQKAQAEMQMKQAEMQMRMQEKQAEMKMNVEQHQMEMQSRKEQAAFDMQMEQKKAELKARTEMAMASLKMQTEQQKAQTEMGIAEDQHIQTQQLMFDKAQLERSLEQYRAVMDENYKTESEIETEEDEMKAQEVLDKIAALESGQQQLISAIDNLAKQTSKPKKIVRGPDGRVAGVE